MALRIPIETRSSIRLIAIALGRACGDFIRTMRASLVLDDRFIGRIDSLPTRPGHRVYVVGQRFVVTRGVAEGFTRPRIYWPRDIDHRSQKSLGVFANPFVFGFHKLDIDTIVAFLFRPFIVAFRPDIDSIR